MAVINIGILEDEIRASNMLEDTLILCAKEKGIKINIKFCVQTYSQFVQEVQQHKVHLCTVDIDLAGESKNGMDVAEYIVKHNAGVRIAFISGRDDMITKAFRYRAVSFITKPYSKQSISELLDLVISDLDCDDSCLTLSGRYSQRIPHKDIIYIKLDERRVMVRTVQACEYLSSNYTMSSIIKMLPNEHFIQCSAGLVVSKNKIRKLEGRTLELNVDLPELKKTKLTLSSFHTKKLKNQIF